MAAGNRGSLLPRLATASFLAALLVLVALSTVSAQTSLTELVEPQCAHVPGGRDWVFMTFFDEHSDSLSPQARSQLTHLARLFVRHHASWLKVSGYIDGSETEDVGLGTRRAQTVRAFLVEAGIRPEVIATSSGGVIMEGLGGAQKRRVEFQAALHTSEDELPRKRECEEWLRQHTVQCGLETVSVETARACSATKNALASWYLPG